MSENKTQPTAENVTEFLMKVEHPTRRANALELDQMFREVTGFNPVMWGPSLIGYGSYDYTYKTGRSGSFLATGFSPRKSNLSIHIMPGYANFDSYLEKLGKHKKGVSCLYINKLADVDMEVLADLVRAGLKDLNDIWPVQPS